MPPLCLWTEGGLLFYPAGTGLAPTDALGMGKETRSTGNHIQMYANVHTLIMSDCGHIL